MANFVGDIIEESLKYTSVLKSFCITSTRIKPVKPEEGTPWIKQWTLHTVEISEGQAGALAEQIRPLLVEKVWYKNAWHEDTWYADWRNNFHHYIIFPKKIFYVDRRRKEEYEEASRYVSSLMTLGTRLA